MTKFTTPCFIHKNTPELRKKLEKLGYEDAGIYDTKLPYIATSTGTHIAYSCVPNSFIEDTNPHSSWKYGRVDCGENEQLFLALAALREDSDKFQWFVRDEPHETYSKFTLCELDDWDSDFYSWSNDDDMFPYMYHKATPEELIEHFKEKQL